MATFNRIQAYNRSLPASSRSRTGPWATCRKDDKPLTFQQRWGPTVRILLCLWLSVVFVQAQTPASPPAVTLTCDEIETFLKKAKIGRLRSLPVGVTLPSRATLDDGKLQHEAVISTVDITKMSHPTATGTEFNFRDSWEFNVAGYEIAKMLGLNMVPPYVERIVAGVRASVSWMIPEVMMERDRVQKNLDPPDVEKWNAEVLASKAFHELIADTDVNMTNLLITKDWRLWLIDFTRGFRLTKTLQEPERLRATDRRLLAGLRALTRDGLQQRIGRWVDRSRIDALLARRDAIVRIFDDLVAARGESTVLYDFPRISEPCGTGLR
jgi:hypothetical protein